MNLKKFININNKINKQLYANVNTIQNLTQNYGFKNRYGKRTEKETSGDIFLTNLVEHLWK